MCVRKGVDGQAEGEQHVRVGSRLFSGGSEQASVGQAGDLLGRQVGGKAAGGVMQQAGDGGGLTGGEGGGGVAAVVQVLPLPGAKKSSHLVSLR
ncbi:hypothetical protein Sdia_40240 [Streptomyces diastaticus subsp. diastaticus]|uniref:Uncharacterized protein n=1 Tax=Streptomyces diastaticus subsp. diastaticus TaxID=68040 RepID=A0ABQ1CSX9_STRDI|nr:hypothetical protein Sdia_40240 [Streptomyces diastaticus subsp. diastaticus]GGU46226.1 hypothetical protein GCM10015534_56040 [Streptomyces diastaticus subsp. diastaticus]